MKLSQVFLLLMMVMAALWVIPSSVLSTDESEQAEENARTPDLEIIEIYNVRYLLPKGTKFRKRAGVITFEGAGEYTARRLYGMEERLQESGQELKRLERELRHRGKWHP